MTTTYPASVIREQAKHYATMRDMFQRQYDEFMENGEKKRAALVLPSLTRYTDLTADYDARADAAEREGM
jgi:uncharacterized protein YeaO (DUF488 family)